MLGASANAIWPLQVRANRRVKANPRGNARNVIFYEFSGALSHVDSFDFKENRVNSEGFRRPEDPHRNLCAVRVIPADDQVLDKIAIVRSFVSHEEVHLRGQYYVQAGRQLNVAFAHEIPSVGSVVAASSNRSAATSDTFPTYVSFNLQTNQIGALSTGFLPPRFSVFDLNPEQALNGHVARPEGHRAARRALAAAVAASAKQPVIASCGLFGGRSAHSKISAKPRSNC